jgi:hypothetical protein
MGSISEQRAEYLWHETSPGVFRRSMIPMECFFNPEMGWSVWVSIKLDTNTSINFGDTYNEAHFMDRVRCAWTRALYEQPQLASIYDFSERICTYTTTSEKSLAIWLAETLHVTDDPYTALATREKPTLCVNPTSQELLFRAPHSYTDGIGATHLLADIVKYIANPQATTFGDEAKNLPPIFEIAAGVPPSGTADYEHGAQLTNKFLEGQPSIALPFHEIPSAPFNHSVSEIRLSLENSKALVNACKSRGLTVTHAVHAALIQAVAELNPVCAAQNYTSIHIYNWRARVQNKYQRCRSSLYCGAFPMKISDPATRPFDDLSEELKRMYGGTNQDIEIAKALAPWWSSLLTAFSAVTDSPPVSAPTLSSLGVIEKILPEVIDGIKVEEFKFGIDMKGPTVTVYLWNFKGRVTFSAAWDRGSYEEGEIEAFLGHIIHKLSISLGLSLHN